MLEKIDFEIWLEIFFRSKNLKNRKSKKQGFQLKFFKNQDFTIFDFFEEFQLENFKFLKNRNFDFRFSKIFNWNPTFFDFSIFPRFFEIIFSAKKDDFDFEISPAI